MKMQSWRRATFGKNQKFDDPVETIHASILDKLETPQGVTTLNVYDCAFLRELVMRDKP